LLAAQGISPLGDSMATTALILHLQKTLGTATSVGLLLTAQALPPLASPVAGTVADRVSPNRLLAGAFLLQGLLVGAIALRLPPLGGLLVFAFVLALVDTPVGASTGRAIAMVVADDDLPRANALRAGARELGTVLGPPIAGLLFAAGGTRPALIVDAVTFLVAIPLVIGLPVASRAPHAIGGRFRTEVREGLAFVWQAPEVRAIALGFWTVVFFSAPDDLILPFLATLTFGAGPVAVGVLLAAASVGVLLGFPLVGRVSKRGALLMAVAVSFAVMATGNLLTAAAPVLAAAFAAQVLRGIALPVADSLITTHLQRTTPPELLGRVLGNVYGGVSVAAALGYLAGGPLVDHTSPRFAFVAVGLGGLLGAAVVAGRARA
jgi:MFS family permease